MMILNPTYCRRLPHLDLVLSEIEHYWIGNGIEKAGEEENEWPHPARKSEIFDQDDMKIPKMARNIWLANMPMPKAILLSHGDASSS